VQLEGGHAAYFKAFPPSFCCAALSILTWRCQWNKTASFAFGGYVYLCDLMPALAKNALSREERAQKAHTLHIRPMCPAEKPANNKNYAT